MENPRKKETILAMYKEFQGRFIKKRRSSCEEDQASSKK